MQFPRACAPCELKKQSSAYARNEKNVQLLAALYTALPSKFLPSSAVDILMHN